MVRLIAATLGATISFVASAEDMSVGDFLVGKSKPATVEYVAGIGEGMDFLNNRTRRMGAVAVFCVPENLKLNAANYVNILETEIARDPKRNAGLRPLVGVMADGLIRTFPCK